MRQTVVPFTVEEDVLTRGFHWEVRVMSLLAHRVSSLGLSSTWRALTLVNIKAGQTFGLNCTEPEKRRLVLNANFFSDIPVRKSK